MPQAGSFYLEEFLCDAIADPVKRELEPILKDTMGNWDDLRVTDVDVDGSHIKAELYDPKQGRTITVDVDDEL